MAFCRIVALFSRSANVFSRRTGRKKQKINVFQNKIYTAASTFIGSILHSWGFTYIFLCTITPGPGNFITGHYIIQECLIRCKECWVLYWIYTTPSRQWIFNLIILSWKMQKKKTLKLSLTMNRPIRGWLLPYCLKLFLHIVQLIVHTGRCLSHWKGLGIGPK